MPVELVPVIIAAFSAVVVTAGVFIIVLRVRRKTERRHAGSEQELSQCREALDEKSREISALNESVSDLRGKYADERAASGQKAAELERTLRELNEAKTDIQAKTQKILLLNESVADLQGKYSAESERLAQRTKELERTVQELDKAKTEIQNQDDKIRFIADIINAPPVEHQAVQKFRKLLAEDYCEYAKDNDVLADEAGALLKLQEVERQLVLLSYDEAIIKKTVVAVAGSFSSGKSSFMNSFFQTRKIKLPTGMTQTTAISSYVLADESQGITGYSYKGGYVTIPEKIFPMFSHDKAKEFNFNMKQLINSIVFRNKFVQDFKNLCFIDTPGFNSGAERQSDTEAATTAISNADALIWCINCEDGTIKDDELGILDDIYDKNKSISIYIVVNKADLRPVEDVEPVIDEIENRLQEAGIPFEGISAYSSHNSYSQQSDDIAGLVRGMSLQDFLSDKDVENNQQESLLQGQVREVFDRYIQADKDRIEKLKGQIKTFDILHNTFLLQLDKKDELILRYKARQDKHYKGKIKDNIEEDDDEIFDSLIEMREDLKKTIKKDESDIEEAERISLEMQKCIADLFGHTLNQQNAGESTADESKAKVMSALAATIHVSKLQTKQK